MTTREKNRNFEIHYFRKIKPELKHSHWVLRLADHKDKPPPVFVIKERILPDKRTDAKDLVAHRSILKECGTLYGESQRRCLPVIRSILARICDQAGIPMELHQIFNDKRITFRGNLPLNEEAGYKIGLIFKLH